MIQYKVKYSGYLSSSETDSEDVDFSSVETLKDADWIVYNYQTGSYEGDGVAIHKKNGKYYQSGIGHCSCYGPEDGIKEDEGFNSLEELTKKCSESLNKELLPLIEFIKNEKL